MGNFQEKKTGGRAKQRVILEAWDPIGLEKAEHRRKIVLFTVRICL